MIRRILLLLLLGLTISVSPVLFGSEQYMSVEAAQETGFLTPGKATFLYMDTKELKDTYGDEQIKFVMQKGGVLHLMSRNGKEDYLSFTGYDGTNAGIGYRIRKVYTMFPQMVFFEIIADRGAHAKNCGYWIVGKHDDKWVTYVSIDSLVNMGYTPWEWHQIKTEMNSDATGRFILISSHEYMPPGTQFGYQLKHAVDLKLQLFWDKEAGWFGIRRLE